VSVGTVSVGTGRVGCRGWPPFEHILEL
jgi:hypothetical protein